MEIERLIIKHGADTFSSGWAGNSAVVAFRMSNRFLRFVLPLPDKSGSKEKGAQLERARWRALLLVLKAKLEAVEAGISDFETEFLGNISIGSGQTVADVVKPRLAETYSTGGQLALPPGSGF